MRSNLGAGIVAGLIAGIVFGIGMQIMSAPTPEGGEMPMMAMVAKVVRSDSLFVGWLYHLFNSAVIGGLFGALLGARIATTPSALGWGAAYGFGWWILGGLMIMPAFLGQPPLAPLMMPEMRGVAMGSLMGHLVFGLILGPAFRTLRLRAPSPA